MAFKMSTIAIILLAHFTTPDSARIRQSKTEGILDAMDAHASEDGAVSPVVGVEAEAAGPVFSPAFHGTVRWKQLGDEWGFLTSSEVQGDIFVHLRENPELGASLYVGEQVIFELTSDKDGQPRAKNAARPAASGSQLISGSGPVMTGVLASFKDEWGLIQSPSLPKKLFCGEKDNPAIKEQGILTGDEVQFEIGTNIANGKSKAVNTRLVVKDQSELVGRRCSGIVKSWRGGWGLASSSKFTGLIMLGKKQIQVAGLGWLKAGAPLQFEVSHEKDGKYEAVNISSFVPGAMDRSWTPRAGSAGRMTGTVKTFGAHWGFIQSDQHQGDIYVSAGAADGPLKTGEMVAFDLDTKTGNHNGARAANVVRLSPGRGTHTPPPMPMRAYVPQAPPALPNGKGYAQPSHGQGYAEGGSKGYAIAPGQKVSGTMVIVRDTWAFVKTVSVQGRLFAGMRDNPAIKEQGILAGDEVQFEVGTNIANGESKAVNTCLVVRDQAELVGRRCSGIVKTWRDGWGLASSSRFTGLILLGTRQIQASGLGWLQAGAPLQFEVGHGRDGKYEAVNITSFLPGTRDHSWTPRGGSAGRMTGTVESFLGHWGFIHSDQHQGDIYVSAGAAGGPLKTGEMVAFDLDTKPGNHNGARAANVVRLSGGRGTHTPPPMPMRAYVPQAPPALANGKGYAQPSHDQPGRKVSGTMVSVKDTWAFVKTASLQEDVFAGFRDNPAIKEQGILIGDEVQFEVGTSMANGKSKAFNTCLVVKDQAELVGRRCSGIVKHWRDGWGLASSSKFTGLIMLGKKQIQAAGLGWLQAGAPLQFEVGNGKDGKYEAVNISSFVPGARDPSWTPRAGSTGRMTGTVKSFHGHWGFIQSDQHQGDIYVSAGAADGPLKTGEMVSFDLETKPGNHNGARAANVMRLSGEGGRAYSPPLMPMRAYVPQAPHVLSNGEGYAKGGSKGYATALGQKVSGTMAVAKDAWGFVRTVQGDFFLGMRDNPQLAALPAVGDKLSFELTLDPQSGRYKAVSVAPSLKGTRVRGTVTKVRDGGGGFATSEGVEGTVILSKRSLSVSGIKTIHQGDVLEYEINVGRKVYAARNIRVVSAH